MKIILSLLFISLSYTGMGQEYFNKRFSFGNSLVYDGAVNALEVNDGYIINGSTGDSINYFWNRQGMVKLDFQGNILWRKTWGDTISQWWYCDRGSLIKHANAYYSVGNKSTMYDSIIHSEIVLIKYNNTFDTLWSAYYGKKHLPYDTSYIPRNFKNIDNGFIITGTLQKDYGGKTDPFLIKMDSLGNALWEQSYPDNNYYYEGMSVITTTDQGYAIGVYRWVIGPYGASIGDPVVIKTDSLGNKEWELNLGGQYQDGSAILCQSEDGNILAAARFDVDSLDPFRYYSRIQFCKLDNFGHIIYNYLYGDKVIYENVSNIRAVGDNGVIITGSHWHPAPNRMGFMLRINSLGDSLWYRQYAVVNGENSLNFLTDALPVSDGGFLSAGWCYPIPPDTGTQDAWAIKVDSFGCTSPGDCWVGQKENKTTENINELFTVYPNPAKISFIIKTDYEKISNYELKIFDIYGNKVKDIIVPKGRCETKINVVNWKKGLYIIRIIGHNVLTSSRKLILTK